MTRDEIKKLALDFGFTLREQRDGSQDLSEYVYAFAEALRPQAEIDESRIIVRHRDCAAEIDRQAGGVKIVMSVINSAERDGVFAWDEVEALLQALNLAVYRWRGC